MPTRERLLGFAFAAADLLLELAPDGEIVLALGSGPAPALNVQTLQGSRLGRHLDGADATKLAEALASMQPGQRLGPLPILMTWATSARKGSVRLFRLPELAPNISCAIAHDGPVVLREAPLVLDANGFLARARALLSDADSKPATDLAVAFIDIAGLGDTGTDPRIAARVEATLQSASIDGESAARLSPERFALLRDRDDGRDVADELRQVAREEAVDLTVASSEQTLTGLGDLNALRALRFAVEACLAGDGLARPELAFSQALARTLSDAETFRAVVRERRFDLHYQPIVDLKTRAVHHFEALARFSPTGSPASVIHMAEEMALIDAFDLAVASKAVTRLRQPGSGLLKIAINVSGASLATDAYSQALLKMTADAPDDRKRLIVEVTESAALADIEAANRRLSALRRAGIRVCIDDFGAGSASFDYVRGLSVDTVKIDGRFIRGIEGDAKSRTLIGHLVDLCASLNVSTIAEMIETEDAAVLLRDLGVDRGQGWLFGRAEAEPRTSAPAVSPARRMGAVEAWG